MVGTVGVARGYRRRRRGPDHPASAFGRNATRDPGGAEEDSNGVSEDGCGRAWELHGARRCSSRRSIRRSRLSRERRSTSRFRGLRFRRRSGCRSGRSLAEEVWVLTAGTDVEVTGELRPRTPAGLQRPVQRCPKIDPRIPQKKIGVRPLFRRVNLLGRFRPEKGVRPHQRRRRAGMIWMRRRVPSPCDMVLTPSNLASDI